MWNAVIATIAEVWSPYDHNDCWTFFPAIAAIVATIWKLALIRILLVSFPSLLLIAALWHSFQNFKLWILLSDFHFLWPACDFQLSAFRIHHFKLTRVVGFSMLHLPFDIRLSLFKFQLLVVGIKSSDYQFCHLASGYQSWNHYILFIWAFCFYPAFILYCSAKNLDLPRAKVGPISFASRGSESVWIKGPFIDYTQGWVGGNNCKFK